MAHGTDKNDIRIVAIAASAGGLQALSLIIQEMPGDFPVPIVVVQHLAPDYRSVLDEILQRRSTLRVKWAEDGERLKGGTVYLAPPNRHLEISEAGVVSLTASERVNWVRPAADILFTSVARHYGSHSMAIVLTGNLFDGTAGSIRVKEAGGWVLAQDEESCECPDMPCSAISSGAVDFVLSLDAIPFAILSLVMTFGATSLFKVARRSPPPAAESLR